MALTKDWREFLELLSSRGVAGISHAVHAVMLNEVKHLTQAD
jgi:hypothetical protein